MCFINNSYNVLLQNNKVAEIGFVGLSSNYIAVVKINCCCEGHLSRSLPPAVTVYMIVVKSMFSFCSYLTLYYMLPFKMQSYLYIYIYTSIYENVIPSFWILQNRGGTAALGRGSTGGLAG